MLKFNPLNRGSSGNSKSKMIETNSLNQFVTKNSKVGARGTEDNIRDRQHESPKFAPESGSSKF
jgi:hypothetical protein